MHNVFRLIFAAVVGLLVAMLARKVTTGNWTPSPSVVVAQEPALSSSVDDQKELPPELPEVPGTQKRSRDPKLEKVKSAEQYWVIGYAVHRNRVNVTLSDGRTISEQDGTIKSIRRNFVDFHDLGRVWFKPARDRQKSEQDNAGAQVLAVSGEKDSDRSVVIDG